MIDDSALFHGGYDPVKARAYYLRTRKLKGRKASTADVPSPVRGVEKPPGSAVIKGSKVNRANTKSRQAELLAQKERLEKRLDRLREILAQLVIAAKSRSGVKKPDSKDAAPETQTDKADRNSDEKSKRLTPSQKTAKAKQAKEAYEKEHPNSLSTNVDILKEQVKDIQNQIQSAIADARERSSKAGIIKAEVVRPKDKPKSQRKETAQNGTSKR